MARPSDEYNSLSSVSGISLNPSKILTSAGSGNIVTRVSGLSIFASLESTGLMQKFLMLSSWLSVRLPSTAYTVAVLISTSSSSRRSLTHWSNCPGRNSTANTCSPGLCSKSSSYTISTGGSENTVTSALRYVSSVIPSISYLIRTRTLVTVSIFR